MPIVYSEDEGDAKFSIFEVDKELHLDFKHEEAVPAEQDRQFSKLESDYTQADLIN